jgi:hypothetical protein
VQESGIMVFDKEDRKLERELAAAELEAVAGGTPKLYEAACRGKHLPEVRIEAGSDLNLLGALMAGAASRGSGAVT